MSTITNIQPKMSGEDRLFRNQRVQGIIKQSTKSSEQQERQGEEME